MKKIKIIGSFLFFCILCAKDLSGINLTLKMVDSSGNELKRASVGVPFIIKVAVEGETDSRVEIAGLDKFYYRSLGTNSTFRYINGSTSVEKIYQYEVRIDKEGEYNLGPAQIKIDNDISKSNILNIFVSKEQPVKENSETQSAFVTLKINKDHIVVGEQIELTARFYFSDEVKPIGIENLELKDFTFSKFRKTIFSNQKIGNKNYTFQEWESDLVPKKAGELLIPSIRASYELLSQRNMSGFPFFASNYEQKEIRSNTIKVSVDSLPEYQGTVNGIGIFKNFTASVNQTESAQGEGIVLKLEIEGKGNLENLKVPQLSLPIQLRYYDSKNYIEESKEKGFKKKVFEFIIQGLENGDFTIDSQTFTFFNTRKKFYETLKTNPINLKIKQLSTKVPMNLQEKKKIENIDMNNGDIAPIYSNFSYSKSHQREIPKFWFLFLVLVPILIKTLLSTKSFLKKNNFFIKKNSQAFKEVQKKIALSKEANSCLELHQIFISFFAQCFEMNQTMISSELIIQKLKEKGLTQDELDQWQIYFDKIIESAYSHSEKQCSSLLEQAQQWVKVFKKLL